MTEDVRRFASAQSADEVLGVNERTHRQSARGFTPGPWSWSTRGDLLGGDQIRVLAYDGNLPHGAMRPADARLIAAAPELYEALRKIVGSAHQMSVPGHGSHLTMVGPVVTAHALDNARAALAKADGPEAVK